jgi:peroxiredoxin Q/BCP
MRLLTCCTLLLFALIPAAGADDVKKSGKAEVGKPAPDISLPATQIDKVLPSKKDAKTLSLKDFKGKKNVVLYFYPKAMTGGCTAQSCAYRDLTKQFAKLDTVVLGISTDKLADQKKFTDKEDLNFPLLADADKKFTKTYGVYNTDRGLANRVTFIIDKKGVVRKIIKVKSAKDDPKEVLEYVKEKLADK